MDTDKAAIQTQLDDIEKPGGSKHEAWLRKDAAVMAEREDCYKRMYPEPIEPTPPPPPPAPANATSSQPASSQPPTISPAEVAGPLGHDADDTAVLFEELRTRPQWNKDFDGALATANQENKFLWREGNVADETIFDRLLSHPIATHPDLFDVMLKAGQDRRSIGEREAAPVAGSDPLTMEQQTSLVLQTATHYFGQLKGNRLFEDFISAIGIDEAAWQWAVSVGRRLWGK
jgi:hypothetical protein